VMVLLPMFISNWIQMLGPNQGMGKGFIIWHVQIIHFTRKQVGGGMNFWSHIISSLKHSSSRIWMNLLPLSGPPKICKQYEVRINDYSTCSWVDFFPIMFASFNRWGFWV
jgi:hypothetical protein